MERKQMTGTFRRPMTAHTLMNLAFDDAGHVPEIRDDYEYLSEIAEKENRSLFGKGYIEGEDRRTYYVTKENSAEFAEGDRVEFQYIPRPPGERCWARNIGRIK